jgi:hypothetical protein
MFKLFTATDFTGEIIKALPNTNFSIQILLSIDDLEIISKSLFNSFDNDIYADIIISAKDEKRPLLIINIINRLIDCGANVYWSVDNNILKHNSHFFISDKVIVINKVYYQNNDDIRKQVFYFLEIFDKIKNCSEPILFNDKKIEVKFTSDKSIIKKNESVKLFWEIKNADFYKITPDIGFLDLKSSNSVQLEKDTLFKLEAKNNFENLTKFIFIKVIKPKDFNVYVKVYDPIIKEFIFLEPKYNSDVENYICYYSQQLVICFDFGNSLTVTEKKIGNLKPNQELSFFIKEPIKYVFKYSNLNKTEIKKVKIIPIKDDSFLRLLKNKN